METKNIMIVGVGGQGTLLARRVLGRVLLTEGYDVKISEVHGMSQRGGSVVTYVRYGEKVYSPIIDPGQVDLLLAFEQLEAYRWLPYLKADGRMVVNKMCIRDRCTSMRITFSSRSSIQPRWSRCRMANGVRW